MTRGVFHVSLSIGVGVITSVQQQPTSQQTRQLVHIDNPPKPYQITLNITTKMQFKLSIAVSALLALSSAMILEPKGEPCPSEHARARET